MGWQKLLRQISGFIDMTKEMFCSVCGKILSIKKDEGGKNVGVCSCGFAKEIDSGFSFSQSIKKDKEKGKGILVETESRGFSNVCKNCGHGECEVHEMLPSYSDESDVVLYRCKKCKVVHRQHDGTGNK